MRLKTIVLFGLPVLLWTGFIFVLSFHPNPVNILPPSVQREVKKGLPRPISLDNAGHIAIYASLGALLVQMIARAARPKLSLLPALGFAMLAGTAIALLDESLQELSPGRAFELSDLGLDLLAMIAGAALTGFTVWLRKNRLQEVSKASSGD